MNLKVSYLCFSHSDFVESRLLFIPKQETWFFLSISFGHMSLLRPYMNFIFAPVYTL